jgi:gliding motility-associated-like protein
VGTCNAQDSVFVKWKDIEFLSKTDVNCRNGATGVIKVLAGYEWTPPLAFSLDGINWQTDSVFTNLPVGNYWVKVKDAVCTDSILVSIAQAYPDLPASCSGNPDGQLTVTASGGNGPYTYSTDGTSFQASNIFNLTQGNYTITVKDNSGCINTKPITIALDNTVTADAGNDDEICEGTGITLPAVSNGTSFVWTPAATLSDAAILTPVASPVVTTKYYITATSGICNRTDSVTISVLPAPVANAGSDAAYCYGKLFQLSGSGGVSYQWSPSTYFTTSATDQFPTVKANTDITYTLMVTDANGCTSLVPDAVAIDVTPPIKIFAGNDTVAAINQPIQLHVKELGIAGVTQYSWSPANFLNDASIASPIAILPYDYRYIVTASTPEGCEGKDDIFIKVYKGPDIYVPSGFTPNNDGLNDRLGPIPVGIKEFRFFRVFNRWGQLVFSTSDPRRTWDGTLNGVQQPTGTFIWMAEAVDYKGNLVTRKGVVTIIR